MTQKAQLTKLEDNAVAADSVDQSTEGAGGEVVVGKEETDRPYHVYFANYQTEKAFGFFNELAER